MNPNLNLPANDLARFCQSHGVRQLALFGSATRDELRDDSDIDVLIDLKREARVGFVALQKMRDELSAMLGRPVDLVTRNGLNRHIRDQVLREAEVVYAE